MSLASPVGPSGAELHQRIVAALAEDHAEEDATTQSTVPAGQSMRGRIVARGDGVVCGRDVLAAVFHVLDAEVSVEGLRDGAKAHSGQVVWEVHGSARAILAGERVALNFVQHLCGVATMTAQFVAAVSGTNVSITDTRKTTPLWRDLEKYAVRCGGGVNHRMHLADMLLIKENHIAAAGSVSEALRRARQVAQGRPVEIEVRDLREFCEALPGNAQRVMLDHWSVADIAAAIQLRGAAALPEIEVSGNLDLQTIRQYALPGVSYLSVGRLTHSAPVLDLSLLAENC